MSASTWQSSRRIAAIAFAFTAFNLPAMADCEFKPGAPLRYELIELPRINDDAARSEAYSITNSGDILIRSFNHAVDRQVDSAILKSDGTKTNVENIFGAGLIFADTLHENGYITGAHTSNTPTDPRNITTPIILDGKGNGLTQEAYCAPPDGSNAILQKMVVSASGEHAVGLFKSPDDLRIVARCAETGSSQVFSSSTRMEVVGVTDEGEIVGNELSNAIYSPWVTGKNGKRTNPFDSFPNTKIVNANADGEIFALNFGALKVDGIVRHKGKINSIEFFDEAGWNASNGILGRCGELVGEAMQSTYEEFSQLDAQEQNRIRSHTDLINAWDSRRSDARFLWSPGNDTRHLKDAISMEPGWTAITIKSINSRGVMVGAASDPDGITRAIKLIPVK